ncbi:MAG: hypothetical protein J6P60_06540 [Lachnospiraceae bacterium]|nr:hypothetical protein [Lachnospiraceae bacterium]
MSVNGVTSSKDVYSANTYASKSPAKPAAEETGAASKSASNEAAVYEPGSAADTVKSAKTYKADPQLVAKLKADADARTSQMKSLVEQLITKQGQTIGKADDIFSFLAGGNFTVDPATKAQAQADIAEDGYWGVEQTSDRILDFAKAISGGEPEKMNQMLEAFKKGFQQATKTWGKELPDISQRTYDAVIKKFEDYQNAEQTAQV